MNPAVRKNSTTDVPDIPPPPPPPPPVQAVNAQPVRHLADLPGGRFLPEHATLISSLAASQLVQPTPDDRKHGTKTWWFRYFWFEARKEPSRIAEYPELADFFNEMFHLPVTWDPASDHCQLELRGARLLYKQAFPNAIFNVEVQRRAGAWDNPAADPGGRLRRLLDHLLSVGFEEVQPAAVAQGTTPAEAFHTDIDIWRDGLVCGWNGRAYMLGWRGDGRGMADISQAGGFLSAAESDYQEYAAHQNMRQNWHPFQDPAQRGRWLFRRAQEDNCLYTVVSVTVDFKTASTFPRLCDDVQLPAAIPTAEVLQRSPPGTRQKWYRVIGVSQGVPRTVIRHVDCRQLYLVIVTTQYFDTEQSQTDHFPEIAVKSIPNTGILACISFVRVFHGTTDDAGLTALLDRKRLVRPVQERCRQYCQDKLFGNTLYTKVSGLYEETVAALRRSYAVKWTPTGPGDPGNFVDDHGFPMTIHSIEDWSGQPVWP